MPGEFTIGDLTITIALFICGGFLDHTLNKILDELRAARKSDEKSPKVVVSR